MSLFIHSSNRLENLVSVLAEIVKKPLVYPLVPETIIVHSKGMQRWLAMELARHLGVWANCNYPFPNAIIWQLFSKIFSKIPDTSDFSPEPMTWKIFQILPEYLPEQQFKTLSNYLANDREGVRRYQLSVRIADTFDQYTIFRPEILQKWETGKLPSNSEEQWQAILWCRLVKDSANEHRGTLKRKYCNQIKSDQVSKSVFPERLSLFGISYLPPYHLQILEATAEITDLHLFLLSPSNEYWGDIISKGEQARLSAQLYEDNDERIPLLGSLGKLGREFSDMILNLDNAVTVQKDLYAAAGRDSLLHSLQTDILTLQCAGDQREKQVVSMSDRSIMISSCHSPLREVEVLFDTLLELFNNDHSLSPRDVLVMTPDIEQYAPFVSTVFGTGTERIPYSIADRSFVSLSVVATVIIKLLQLPGSRLTSVQIFDILSSEPVRRRYAVTEQELRVIRVWLEETRIRWGMDAGNRSSRGLPEYAENSWRAGVERLLLGYAMPDIGGSLYAGILPFDAMEGSDVDTLAKLLDFLDFIESVDSSFDTSRSLSAWCKTLESLLESAVVNDNSTEHDISSLNTVFSALLRLEEDSGYTGEVSLSVVTSWIITRLQTGQEGGGFMSGGVTFCSMLPMRSIPSKVIAMIGISDGAFPRQSRSNGFDLIAKKPRIGDRSLRDEDRYLFLEAILSARETLYISYVGQSVTDGSDIPPSVLVSELLDAVDQNYAYPEDGVVKEYLVAKQRLQPFSKDYFISDSRLYSYSLENYHALHKKNENNRKPFLSGNLASPPEEMLDLQLSQLIRFYNNPAGFFLQHRLGVCFQKLQAPLEEREPFDLENLEQYAFNQQLLDGVIAGKSAESLLKYARAICVLPPAGHGTEVFKETFDEVKIFADTVLNYQAGQVLMNPLDIELKIDQFLVTGRLQKIWSGSMFRYRYALLKGKDLVAAWIEHLALQSGNICGYPSTTVLIMKNSTYCFKPVNNAAEILRSLLELYWSGLTAPLHYFPKASYAFSLKSEWSIEKARKEWNATYNGIPPEAEDAAFKRCFQDCDPIDDEFVRIAKTIYIPLIEHLCEVKT